ncbi:MAG: hypothetical protein ABI670_15180 [Chloroflexota bacterium]
MRLELNGKIISEHPDEVVIASALQQMANKGDVLALRRPPADFIQAQGTTSQGFTLNVYEDAEGISFASHPRRLDGSTVAGVMARFAEGSGDWRSEIGSTKWQSGDKQQEKAQRVGNIPGVIGLIALAVFGIPFVAWATLAGTIGGSTPLTWGDTWKGLVAIVLLSAYVSWIELFFQTIRPSLAERLGKRLRTEVQGSTEAYDMGMWVAPDGTPMNRVLVFFIDVGITIAGVAVPLALPAVVLFVLFNK